MFQTSLSISHQLPRYQPYPGALPGSALDGWSNDADDSNDANDENRRDGVLDQIVRRWRRERRRRRVGRAYDMSLEISRQVSRQVSLSLRRRSAAFNVLDVGCGNGYIAHHLSAMLGAPVLGIDLEETTEAIIDYRSFDGARFPVETASLDVILFCYVLHHAQDLGTLLGEARRVLRAGGEVVVYEDIPDTGWDRFICRIHDRQWRGRTGPCTFNTEAGWRRLFESAGFEVVKTRSLSRWRNLAHPVSRRLFVLALS